MSGMTWTGLEAFRAALRALPVDLTDQATGLVDASADAAAAEIRAAYPARTGNLRSSVRVATIPGIQGDVTRSVRSEAPYAHFIEYGYVAHGPKRRHIPGRPIVVPVLERRRRQLVEDLISVVETAGLDVRR